jgi:hypothetical protein
LAAAHNAVRSTNALARHLRLILPAMLIAALATEALKTLVDQLS